MPDAPATARGRSRLGMWLLCQALRRPRLLRLASALLRRWPLLSGPTGSVARRDAVVEAFERTASFAHTAHAPNLVAGEFVIGIQDGPRHDDERRRVERLLLPAEAGEAQGRRREEAGEQLDVADEQDKGANMLGEVAAKQASALREAVAARAGRTFDLVDDYLGPLVWRTLKACFAEAADPITRGAGGRTGAEEGEALLLRQLRHVGSHLVIGEVANAEAQARAEAAGAALQLRVAPRAVPLLRGARDDAIAASDTDNSVRRAAVGMMWVAHPATVQAAAHALLELMARPPLYCELQAQVHRAGEGAFADKALRAQIESHVLELLRFRPPFPVLVRDVPRPSWLHTGDVRALRLCAGRKLRLWVIGALFDERAVPRAAEFDVHRRWPCDADRRLVFGFGPRKCPASGHVLQILTSAMIGLMQLPRLRPAAWRALEYDGPAVAHLALRF